MSGKKLYLTSLSDQDDEKYEDAVVTVSLAEPEQLFWEENY